MGMTLSPVSRAADLDYNWSGWRFIREFAETHGVPTEQLSGFNTGARISGATCRAMADAIEAHRDEYNQAFACTVCPFSHPSHICYGLDPATNHAKAWRESGGMRQW